MSKSFFNKAKCKGGNRQNHGIKRNKIDKKAFLTLFDKSKRVHVPKYTHFSTTGYARVLLFMILRRELGGTGTGCLFQFTYCDMYIGLIFLYFNTLCM